MRFAVFLDTMNGVSMAYTIGLVNALLSLLLAFGVSLDSDQRAALVSFVNAALVLTAHVAHAMANRQAET